MRIYPGHSIGGTVIGRDEYLDLAYIRLEGSVRARPVTFADTAGVKPGQEVMAIGFPLGSELGSSPTVTKGIVSSIRRTSGAEWIQTDAPVNPGSSGGMLVDRKGHVVGVVTSKYDIDPMSGRGVEGVGFALSASDLRDRISYLASGGHILLPTPTPTPRPTATPPPEWVRRTTSEYSSIVLPSNWAKEFARSDYATFNTPDRRANVRVHSYYAEYGWVEGITIDSLAADQLIPLEAKPEFKIKNLDTVSANLKRSQYEYAGQDGYCDIEGYGIHILLPYHVYLVTLEICANATETYDGTFVEKVFKGFHYVGG